MKSIPKKYILFYGHKVGGGGGDFSRVKKVIEIVEIFKGCGTHLQALQW